jgi:PAS domain S-box-containing protein
MNNQYPPVFQELDENHYPSPQQLRRLFDASLDVICSIDLDGRFLHVSKAAEQVWGYTPAELVGQRYIDFVFEEDRELTNTIAAHIMNGHRTTNFENRYRRKDGTIVPIVWSAHWDADEKVMFCIARDFSERRTSEDLRLQYENEIRNQHQEMQNMLERITDGFFALDEFFTVTYWNSQAEVVLRKKREEVLGKNLWECFPEAIDTAFYLNYTKALREQVAVKFTAFFPPLDAWYEVSSHPSIKGLSVFFRDITEQKRSEEELRMLSLVAKETNNFVVVTDPMERITWVNDAFIRRTGYTLEELLGQYPGQLLRGPKTDPGTVRIMQEQSKKGESFHVELLNYTKAKEEYWVEIVAQPVYNEEGVLTHYFAIQNNITERKRLQERLNEDMRQRQQVVTAAVIKAQEQERALVGRELHDNVNQLLTTVKLYQDLCLDNIGNSEELIRRSIDLLQISINEIRNLSKQLSAPTIGNIKLEESVKELVDTVVATNKISIALDIHDMGYVEVNNELHLALYRILQEHLANILKHAEATQVHITVNATESTLELLVTDNGRGFDPKQKRSGIGITNMLTRAVSMKGTLSIESEPSKGCVLSARFPLLP